MKYNLIKQSNTQRLDNTYLPLPQIATITGAWCEFEGFNLLPPPSNCKEISVAARPVNSELRSCVNPTLLATRNIISRVSVDILGIINPSSVTYSFGG